MTAKLPWGVAENRKQMSLALAWREVRLHKPRDIEVARKRANEPDSSGHRAGIYAFEGHRSGLGERHVLYIGQGGTGGKALGNRIVESAATFMEQRTTPWYFYDFSDLVVRFTHMDPNLVDAVEALQILAHSPPYNAQMVRGWARGAEDYVVINAGAKGRLMPVLSTLYYRDQIWNIPPLDDHEHSVG